MPAPITLPAQTVPGMPGATPLPGPMSLAPAPAGTVGMSTPTGPKYVPSLGTPAPKPSTAPTSGTVLSNANVIENTIPSLNQRAGAYQPNPPTILAADGSSGPPQYNIYNGYIHEGIPATASGGGAASNSGDETQDPIFQQEMDMINGLRTSNDDTANASVDSIMRNYQNLASNLTQSQEGPDAMVTNALLRGGTSRYVPGNAAGILSAQHYADIDKIGQLQDEENQKIAAVRQAQATQNYSLVEKTLGELDSVRADKQAATKALADKMQAANDQQTQAKRDSSVATLVAQGITDPTQLLQSLNTDAQGNVTGDFTAAEISKTLAAIQKNTGITDLSSLSAGTRDFFVLKENGQLPGDIGSLPESQQLNAFLKQQYSDTHKDTTTTPGSGSNPISPIIKFTPTQLHKAASNAGIPEADFDKLDNDTKNYFLNSYSNFTAALAKVGTPKPDGTGNFTLDDVKTAIDNSTLSQDGKDILYKKAGIDPNAPAQTADDSQTPSDFWGQGYKGAVDNGLSDAWDYVKGLVGAQ